MKKNSKKTNKKKVWLVLPTVIVFILALLGIDSDLIEAIENEIYTAIGITQA